MPISKTISRTVKSLKSLCSHPNGYPELLWVVFLFVGSVFNAVTLRNFIDWFSPILDYLARNQLYIFQIPEFVLVSIFICIIVTIPVAVSFLFSRIHPEKRIVPPLYIHTISFMLLMFFVYNKIPTDIGTNYILGIYTAMAGILQDRLIVFSLGRTAYRKDIVKHSFKIYANAEKVKQLVTSKQFLERRYLKIIEKGEGNLKIKSDRRVGFQFFLELQEGEEQGVSFLNMASCEIRSYALGPGDKDSDVYDYAMGKIETVREFLKRNNMLVEDYSETNADALVSYILDAMEGTITHFQEMTTRKRATIGISVFCIVISVGLCALGRFEVGIGVLAIAITLITDIVFRN